jgi:putative chitinase
MADVYGDLGGNPIELNNAATETTLKQLLAVMMSMAAASGKGGKAGKAQAELEKELKRLADTAKKKYNIDKGLLDLGDKELAQEKEKQKLRAEELKQLGKSAEKLGAMMGAAEMAAQKLTGVVSALANMQNSLTGAAQALGQIPVVGGTLSAVFGAVAGAAEKTYKSFQQAAEVGANFGGSIGDMIDAATGAGLTIDQFSGIIAKSGESLALLGGTTANGAKRLAELGRGIRDSNLGNELAALGYSTEAINSGLATYSGMLARTGALQGMNNRQLIESTGNYLKNLDAVSKLTGQSKKELEDARNQRMKDAQFRMIMSKMDAASQENLQMLMDTIPEEHREGMKEIIATGTATSEAGKAAMAFLPESAKNMMSLNQQIRTTGKLGADQARGLSVAYQRETKAFSQSGLAETLANFGDETQKRMALGAMNVAARTGDINKTYEQQQKDAEARAAKEKELKEKGLDPASMKAYQEQIAAVSNQFTKLLASSGLLEGMMTVFQGLVGFVSTFLVPAFQIMGDYAGIIGVAFGALATLIAITNARIAYLNFMKKMEAAGILKLLIPLGALILKVALVAAPFVLIGGALYLLYKGIRSLIDNFGEMSDWVLSKLPNWAGGISKEEFERRKKVREENRLREEANKVQKENVQLQKEENEQREQASTGTGYNFSSSQALLESSARRAGTAGSVGATAMTTGAVQDQLKAQLASQGITDPKAVANIMAQVQAESGFKAQSENLNYSGKKLFELYGAGNKGGNKVRFKTLAEAEAVAAKGPEAVGNVIYGGRMGNKEDEGFKYRGRGLIQLTGKDNYKKYGDLIGVDLVSNPDLANDPAIASKIAAAYFAQKQKAGVNLANIEAVGKAVGYAGGAAETAKRAQIAQGFMAAGSGTTATPSGSAAASAVAAAPESKPATQVAATGAAAPGAGGQAASLNDVVASLQTLNMQMGQLVAYNKAVVDINQKQLSVQKGLSGDMMASVGIAA